LKTGRREKRCAALIKMNTTENSGYYNSKLLKPK